MESGMNDSYGLRAQNATAPNTTVMNYSEYTKLQQMKIEMNGGQTLPASIPGNMNPSVPPPTSIQGNGLDASPFPDPNASGENQKTDE